MTPTMELYEALNKAYDFFNDVLFNGELPPCIISAPRRERRIAGYYRKGAFVRRKDNNVAIDEIAINSLIFENIKEVLQTLVHEMCHLKQAHFGTPSRPGYHNKEFADIMESVGLVASTTGKPGGKKVGQKMSDYPIPDGIFLKAMEVFCLENQSFLDIIDAEQLIRMSAQLMSGEGGEDNEGEGEEESDEKKKKDRVKFECPNNSEHSREDKQRAWARPSAKLICGCCKSEMVIVEKEKGA